MLFREITSAQQLGKLERLGDPLFSLRRYTLGNLISIKSSTSTALGLSCAYQQTGPVLMHQRNHHWCCPCLALTVLHVISVICASYLLLLTMYCMTQLPSYSDNSEQFRNKRPHVATWT